MLREDLSKRNSLTKYILDYSSDLNSLEKTKDKSKLVQFIKKAKDLGYHISDQKIAEIISKINSDSFLSVLKNSIVSFTNSSTENFFSLRVAVKTKK